MTDIGWRENGIALTTLAAMATSGLIAAEHLVAKRAASPVVISVAAAVDDDDDRDGGEDGVRTAVTVPLYGSLDELGARAQQALSGADASPDLLYELARQARQFQAYALADALLARCLERAPVQAEALFLRARTQSDLGHPQRAIEMYEAVLEIAPHHQKATYNLGVLLRRAGKFAQADAMLAQAAATSSGRLKAKTLNQLGLTRGALGRWEDAAQVMREAVSLRPDAARYWFDLGTAERECGRLDDAVVAYDKALAINRRFADAHAALGALHEQRDDRAKALQHLGRAVRLADGNAAYRRALAELYLDDDSPRKARDEFAWLAQNAGSEADRAYADAMLALLARDAGRLFARLKRADALQPGAYDKGMAKAVIALEEQKQHDRARVMLGILQARRAPTPDVLLAAARAALRLGDRVAAESLLRRSVQARPENSEAWFQLGRVLSERDDVPGAIAAYRSSLARNPGARNTRLNLAVLYARDDREADALALYDGLLESHPRYTPALVNRARLHERAGRSAQALADLEAALRVAPDDTDVRRRLAQLLLRGGQTARALALLSEAVAEAPSDPDVRLLLAEAQLREGRRPEALRELGRAAALAGDNARLLSRLADLYREAGDPAAAAQAKARAARAGGAPAPSKESP